MRARAVRSERYSPGALSPNRRIQAARGAVEAWAHEGPKMDHCLELRTTGALGTLLLSRQNLSEIKRAVEAAEELFEQLDDRVAPFLRPPQKLDF